MTGVRRAVVIGASPAGLAAAVALRRTDVDSVVCARAAALSDEGDGPHTLAQGAVSLAALRGVPDVARARSLPSAGTAMRTHGGQLLSEITGPELDGIGGRGLALHRAELLGALAGQLGPDAIRFGRRCAAVRRQFDGATAVFADGSEGRASFLVGADGFRPRIRAGCGADQPLRYGGFVPWRATIEFRLPDTPGLLSFGGSYQFGIWRIPSDQVYWFASAPVAEAAQRHVPPRPPELFHRWHDPVGALIDATAAEQITVSGGYDCAPLTTWNARRVVLVGDAEHPIPPRMRQGASQAFQDPAVLAEELLLQPDARTALRQYHRRRARSACSQARVPARVGIWQSPLARRLREMMIAAVPRGCPASATRTAVAFAAQGEEPTWLSR